jgi:hypothetical protein
MNESPAGLAKLLLDWKDVLLAFGLAGFFGMVRYLQDFILVEGTAPSFKWLIAVAKTLTAAATGLLTAWLCKEWQIGPYMSAVMIATAGYGGAETLNVFKDTMRNAIAQLFQPRR